MQLMIKFESTAIIDILLIFKITKFSFKVNKKKYYFKNSINQKSLAGLL